MRTPEQRAKQNAANKRWAEANPEKHAAIREKYRQRRREVNAAIKAGLPVPPPKPKAPGSPGRKPKDTVSTYQGRKADGRYPQAAKRIVWVPVVGMNYCGDSLIAYRGRTVDGDSLPVQKHELGKAGHLQPVTVMYYLDGENGTVFSEDALVKKLEKVGLL